MQFFSNVEKRKEDGAKERINVCPTKRQRLNKFQRDKICFKKKFQGLIKNLKI